MKGRYAVFAFSEKGMMGEAGHVLIVDSKGRKSQITELTRML